MKNKISLLLPFAGWFFLMPVINISAQDFSDAGAYMNYISEQYNDIRKDMMSYMSSIAHSKSARKEEKRRLEVMQTTKEVRSNIRKMKPFKEDATLRDSLVSFLTLSYNILNYDYEKIVNMEEIAEQSYDAMEAYLTAQEIANDKLDAAGDRLDSTVIAFAARYDVKLVEEADELTKKLVAASEAIKYYNVIYLIFFKVYKQEAYMLNALSNNDFSGIEQNRFALIKEAENGLEKIGGIKSYKGDMSLISSCKQLLTFYKKEADTDIPVIIDFMMKKEKLEKLKSALESKTTFERTSEEIDAYNKAVNDYNKSVNIANTKNTSLNNNRKRLLDQWENTVDNYMARQIPKYR